MKGIGGFSFRRLSVILIIGTLISIGWYLIQQQKKALIETNIAAYQQTEMEIVRAAARSIKDSFEQQTTLLDDADIERFEQEILEKVVNPIHLLENGDAWICTPDRVVLDLSSDFPEHYRGKSMAEIFEMQKVNGASHYEEMALAIAEAREGWGWYVWLPETGKEIAAWTPVETGMEVWIVGLSTPLDEILASTGASRQIKMLDVGMWAFTILLIVLYLFWEVTTNRQNRMGKVLEKSEKRYQQLFDAAPDGISVLNKKGKIVECSQSTARLYGYDKPANLRGKHITSLMSEKSLPVFEEKFPLLQKLQSVEGEIQVIRRDGETRHLWRKGTPLANEEGEFSGALIYDRDITPRVKTHREYRKLSQAVEQSASMVMITDFDGKIEYVNPKFEQVTGYSREEVVGKNPRILKSGEHTQEFYENLWETINAGQEWHGEFCNKRKNGSIYWEQGNIAPVFDEAGNITHFAATREDITHQIYIERALQRSYRDLEKKVDERTAELRTLTKLVETASEAVVVVSLDGTLTYVNESLVEMLGFQTPDGILGESMYTFTNEKGRRSLDEEIVPTLFDQGHWKGILYAKRKDGSVFPADVIGSTIYDEEGNPEYLAGIFKDVTERIKTQEALIRYQEIVDATSDHMSLISPDYTYLAVNDAYCRAHKKKQKEIIGHSVASLMGEEIFLQQIKPELDRCLQGEEITYQAWFDFPRWGRRFMSVSYSPFSDGDVKGVVVSSRDITQTKKLEEKLRKQATMDPLTKVYNRRHFFELAQQELERAQRYKHTFSIIIFDIDHFKKVNDTYGHGIGDEVLQNLAQACRRKLRENDILARYGGEEFVILLPETGLAQAQKMAERMRRECGKTAYEPKTTPLNTLHQAKMNFQISITLSFGISHLEHGEDIALDKLLLRADQALYNAKETGRDRVCVWDKTQYND